MTRSIIGQADQNRGSYVSHMERRVVIFETAGYEPPLLHSRVASPYGCQHNGKIAMIEGCRNGLERLAAFFFFFSRHADSFSCSCRRLNVNASSVAPRRHELLPVAL